MIIWNSLCNAFIVLHYFTSRISENHKNLTVFIAVSSYLEKETMFTTSIDICETRSNKILKIYKRIKKYFLIPCLTSRIRQEQKNALLDILGKSLRPIPSNY